MDQQSDIRCDIRTYLGREDGFRFGEVTFHPGGPRHFLLDRLNRTVRIWQNVRKGVERPDLDHQRISCAMSAFVAMEPMP